MTEPLRTRIARAMAYSVGRDPDEIVSTGMTREVAYLNIADAALSIIREEDAVVLEALREAQLTIDSSTDPELYVQLGDAVLLLEARKESGK